MQRGPDSVLIDPLDVINVGRWRLLKAHRLQDRWIGMFHVKHRSINCVHELVRWIVRGRTYGINHCAHHAVALQSELCAVVWWIAYTWIPVDRWCRVVCWRLISQWERKFRIQNKRARAWCAYEGNSCSTSEMQEYFRGRKAIKTQFDIYKGMLDTQQRSQVHHVVPICWGDMARLIRFGQHNQRWIVWMIIATHPHRRNILVNVSRETLTSVDWLSDVIRIGQIKV